jgi:septum formation protein
VVAELRVPLVLASASPRRREILARLGLSVQVRPSGVDEAVLPAEPPERYALRVADAKAAQVASELEAGGTLVIGCDTVVAVDGRIFGKPDDDAHAADMLEALSGRWHEVITAVALHQAGGAPIEALAETTAVRFRPLSSGTIARYVATSEGRDKAGAYAVQGLGAGLVAEVRGSYDNVVGLPATRLLELLERHGALAAWP